MKTVASSAFTTIMMFQATVYSNYNEFLGGEIATVPRNCVSTLDKDHVQYEKQPEVLAKRYHMVSAWNRRLTKTALAIFIHANVVRS